MQELFLQEGKPQMRCCLASVSLPASVPNSAERPSPTETTSHQRTDRDSLLQGHSIAQYQPTAITDIGKLTPPVGDIHSNSVIEDLPCFQLSLAPNFWWERNIEIFFPIQSTIATMRCALKKKPV